MFVCLHVFEKGDAGEALPSGKPLLIVSALKLSLYSTAIQLNCQSSF